MDDRMDIEEQWVDGHLSEVSLEAVAGDRQELLHPEVLAHLGSCAACAGALERARADHAKVAAALRVELSDAAIRDLVAGVLEKAAASPPALVSAPAPRASRRSLAWAAGIGALAALTLGILSLEGLPTIGGLVSVGQRLWTISSASHRLVETFVPGGWGSLALGLSLLLLLLVAPLRALLKIGPSFPARAGALALTFLGIASFAAPARALDFEGEWPVEEHLSVVADDVPASVALERAAEAAGLGFVGALAVDPLTHLRVRDASLRDVVVAVLGRDAPFVVERTPTLLIVRPAAPAPIVPSTPITPVLPSPLPVVSAQATPRPPVSEAERRSARERVTFGDDVHVGPDEIVESVVTMGGDATIDGQVLRDVVSMGGDVHVRTGGVVYGEIIAMGGEVRVDEGAQATSRVELSGSASGVSVNEPGEDEVDDGNEEEEPEDPAGALAAWVGDALSSAARHALLFLFGLLLLGLLPSRLDTITRTVVTLPGRAVLAGLLSSLAAVVLALVLTITIVGIPAAVLLGLAAAVAIYAGFVSVAGVLGRILPIRALEGSPVLQLAAGVLGLFVISLVPVIGTLLVVIAALLGLGAVVLTRAGTRLVS